MLQPEKKKKIPAHHFRRIFLVVMILVVLVAGISIFVVRKIARPARIVYMENESVEGPGSEVIVINADASGPPINVSNSPEAEDDADWLPDGSAIIFERWRAKDATRYISIVSPDGTDRRALNPIPGGSYKKAISPDGNRIVVSAFTGTHLDIMVTDMQGKNTVNLTNTAELDEVDPIWSPDGSQIAYICGEAWLCVMSADGTQPRALSTTVNAFSPKWSPDGTYIGFSCGRRLCVMRADGSESPWISSYTVYADFDWSPDSTRLAFVGKDGEKHPEIFVINVDGSNSVQLTANGGSDWSPDWSPDGSQIAFVSTRDNSAEDDAHYEIYVMNDDGSDARRLTYTKTVNVEPRWQPNPCGAWDILCYLTRP